MFFVSMLALFWITSFLRASLLITTLTLLSFMLIYARVEHLSLAFITFVYVPELIVLLVFAVPFIRRHLISSPVQHWVRRILPPISSTEKEAIAAGDVWLEAEIFRGSIDFKKHKEWKKYQLSAEEQAFINGPVVELCNSINDWEVVHHEWGIPADVWTLMKKHRFFGLIIPKSYGGLGFSATAHSTIVGMIASKSPSAAVVAMVPNSLGPAELLIHYGTEEQKNYYLPRLACGEEIPCFALTGLEAGSDASAMLDYGVVCYEEFQGEKTLGMRISWNKRYITLAPVATVMGLAFKLFDPDAVLGSKEELGITVCLIPTNHPGVVIGRRHNPLGMAFPNGPTSGKDVFVPMSWIIGGAPMVGQGWRMLVECLSVGRGISLPSLATAVGHFSSLTCAAYARVREQFKVAIGHFEGIQDALGEIGGLTFLIEATRLQTAGAIDDGVKPAIVSAISKYHMTTIGRIIVNHAMDIEGGKGIILGPRNTLGHAYMAAPISITVEGANILTRSLMIFGQGAIRCHPYLLKEMEYAAEDRHLNAFDQQLFAHVGYSVSNVMRCLTFGLTCGALYQDTSGYYLTRYPKRINLLSCGLSVASDISFAILGGDLKRKESLSARLGDVMSYLYMAMGVIHYHASQSDLALHEDFAVWSLDYCIYHAQESLLDFCDNFPITSVGFILKKMIFPYGKLYKKPSDRLTHRLAKKMIQYDHAVRHIHHLVAPPQEGEPTFYLIEAFKMSLQLEDVLKRVAKFKKTLTSIFDKSHTDLYQLAAAEGIIDPSELTKLLAYEKLRHEVIMTDDFSFNEFAQKGTHDENR
jgi:alkylation response protein AidB-like acyl-CoA dehydrogenase